MDVRFDPFLDAILREHLVAAARKNGVALAELEDLLSSPSDAIEYLKECGVETYLAYLEAATAAVDDVGWIVVPRTAGGRAGA